MVKKAVAFIKEQGPEKSYPEVSNKAGKFIDRDLYVVVYQLDGKVLAHGSNEKFVGKDMSDAQDVSRQALRQGARRTGGEAGVVLAGLQVRQPSYEEGRAQADVLRTGRQHRGLCGHLQELTTEWLQVDCRVEGSICSAGSKTSACPGRFSLPLSS